MQWIGENWFSLLSVLGLGIGGIFALMQWYSGSKLKRAEFINQIIDKLRFNEDVVKAMYLVDYNQDWYDEDFHGGSAKEMDVDRLLSYLSYICYLIKSRHITKEESSILEYELRRACESHSVQAYHFNLYHFSQRRKSTCSFQYLIDFGLRNGIIEKDFMNKNSSKFPKYLNF